MVVCRTPARLSRGSETTGKAGGLQKAAGFFMALPAVSRGPGVGAVSAGCRSGRRKNTGGIGGMMSLPGLGLRPDASHDSCGRLRTERLGAVCSIGRETVPKGSRRSEEQLWFRNRLSSFRAGYGWRGDAFFRNASVGEFRIFSNKINIDIIANFLDKFYICINIRENGFKRNIRIDI